MPEVRKHIVAIASVLKPVDDTRNCEKLAYTLANSGKYQVHLIGSGIRAGQGTEDLHFHPLGRIQRISWKRLIALAKVVGIVRALRPRVLMVTTHELLWVALYSRVFLGTKIVYDIQENYFLNILHTDAFPSLFRWPVAMYVRVKEIISSSFISLFILAERAYLNQLAFARSRSVVIENKACIPKEFKRTPAPRANLLFSGTLAESTGVFKAIRLAAKLHAEDSTIRLHIIGYCAHDATRTRLLQEIDGKPYILLTGGDEIQPHSAIVQAISNAAFGVVCYPLSVHTAGSFPTKAYEYLACGLPALTTKEWAPLFVPYNACIVFEESTPASEILSKMKTERFYTRHPTDVFWDAEGRRLLQVIQRMIEMPR